MQGLKGGLVLDIQYMGGEKELVSIITFFLLSFLVLSYVTSLDVTISECLKSHLSTGL